MKLSRLILFFIIIPATIFAQNLEYVKSTLFASGTYNVCVDSQYVFGAGHAFFILTQGDNDRLELVNGVILPNYAVGLDVCGNYAYTASDHGLQIVDFSDPQNCVLAGEFYLYNSRIIKVQGNYAYLSANGTGTLKIISILDPYNLSEIGSYQHMGTEPADIVVVGDYLYIADSLYGLYALDVSNRANPLFIGNSQTAMKAAALVSRDTLVYIISNHLERNGDSRSALQVFNTANPYSPICIGIDSLENEYYFDITISGNYAYINTWQTQPSIIIYDISNPTLPELVADYNLGLRSWSVLADGVSLYTTIPISMEGCVKIYDISNPISPELTGRYDSPDLVVDLKIKDSTLYACDDYTGLHSVDISNPALPMIRQNYSDGRNNRSILIRDNLLYGIGPFTGFSIYNIYNPDSISHMNTVEIYGGNSEYISGNYAYVTKQGGFCVIDISNPEAPDSVGSYIINEATYEIKGAGRYLYISSRYPNKLNIFDIMNPISPQFISSIEVTGEVENIALSGNFAYTVSSDSVINVIEISDPMFPSIISTINTPARAFDIEIVDDWAFVACHRAGVIVYDISNPNYVNLLTSYDTPGYAINLAIDYPFVYVADAGSLEILRFNPTGIDDNTPIPLEPSLSQNYPNPFNSSTSINFSIPDGQQSTLNIYDICGRRARSFDIKGQGNLIWNGRDEIGKPASSGVYFYSIAGQPHTARKMLLIK